MLSCCKWSRMPCVTSILGTLLHDLILQQCGQSRWLYTSFVVIGEEGLQGDWLG